MISHDLEAAFQADVGGGMATEDALKSVAEVAKSIKPYKRFGSVKTTAYVFWDGSAFLCGSYGQNVIFSARSSYEGLDEVYLTGSWD
jgi:F0F1-type ATP synthase gamma subunit